MAGVTDLPRFINESMPTNQQIAAAGDPMPTMYKEAQAAYDLQRVSFDLSKSAQGVAEGSAPAKKSGPGMGTSNGR